MTGKTHITAGTLACMALVTYAGYPIACLPLAMIGSILPDADHKNSARQAQPWKKSLTR